MRYTPKQLSEPTPAQTGWAIRTLRKKAEELGRQIVNQVQHFLPKIQLEFSSQDTSWDGY